MILLQVNQLNKYYGADLVLSNIKLEIHTRDRIALVGRNGSGKSTLLKIIAGELAYDSGEIIKPKEVTIGFLDQHTGLVSDRTIWDEMLTVFEDLRSMEKRLRNLEQEMAKEETYTDEGKYKQILSEYDYLQHEFKELGGYQYEADIRSVLHGLNFSTFNYQETKISNLSGGQKTRLALGKLLLSKPDILILDEPTNHLDIDTLTWLEQYLQSYDGAILIVSHDRYFLDKLVNQVYECAQTTLTKYVGNYSQYLVQKAENYERDLKMYEKQQDEIRMKEFIAKNLTRASTTKRAQSRRKALERMQMIDKPHRDDKSANFSFQIERQSGNEVLNVVDLAIGYGANQISKNIHFRIQRGDSIALLGPNGVGKSTLLKTIVGQLQALSGNIHFGANVTIAYYDQEQANLTSNKRVLNELWDEYPTKTEKEIRTILGNFLFSGDDVLKNVSTLSGGEKARLSLAKLMMLNANFLILDEPTNHLDLDSKEILENALVDFPGTILFVSHDRYFINRIATKVFELSTNGVTEYLGDYDYYIEKKEEMMEIQKLSEESEHNQTQEPASDLDAKTRYEQEKELKKLERQKKRRVEEIETLIESLEMEIAEKEQQFLHPEIYSDHTKVAELNKEIEKAKAKIETLLEEWSELE